MVRGGAQMGDAVLAEQRQGALDDAQGGAHRLPVGAGMRRTTEVRPEQLVGGVQQVELHAPVSRRRGRRGIRVGIGVGSPAPAHASVDRSPAAATPPPPRLPAAQAAPMMPEVLRNLAVTTSARVLTRRPHFGHSLLTPPPRMMRSGEK